MNSEDNSTQELVERFLKLFTGNSRSHGVFNPGTKKMRTEHKAPLFDEYYDHIMGKMGLGVVPIMDGGECWFGAIDIDAHGDAPDIDLIELEKDVRAQDLPLTVCRSKSGGAHLYAFGSEPMPATTLRAALARWAATLGYAGCEIYPKQDSLPDDGDGGRQLGNWLNLCYFDAFSDDQSRYAVEGGKRVDFPYFLELAESRLMAAATLVEKGADQHEEAPPCIQRMISDGVGRGQRNEALYNMVIYFKKAYPETWRDKAFNANAKFFEAPLEHSEAKKTIASAGRRDYRYRCREEPCRSYCRSSVCVQRKYGITPEEKGEMELGESPEFTNLVKVLTDPPKWELYLGSVHLDLTTTQLMDYRRVREAVAERLTRMIPPMKNDRWQAQLNKLMESATEVEAPEDASMTGLIADRLTDFLEKADLTSDGENPEDRADLLLGVPVVQKESLTGERRVYFRGKDFVSFLRKNRAEDAKGAALWMALRDSGVEHTRIRAGGRAIPVWFLPLNDEGSPELPDPTFESEF